VTEAVAPPPASRWAAFRHPGFGAYWGAQLCSNFGVQVQTVAVGWQVYDLTRDPFDLGLIGLSQFLPALMLVLVTGAAADRYPRRRIMAICLALEAACAAALLAMTLRGLTSVLPVLGLLALFGTARAFYNPARQALLPNLVPASHLGNAIAVNTTAFQLATISGPVAGGLLYAVSPLLAYGAAGALFLAASGFVSRIPKPPKRTAGRAASWESLSAGFRYIWREKVVLGAISLDLFAVLLGGATALMPVYARDILHVGPVGLGVLQAAPAVGAIGVGFWLMTRPIADHAGRVMFAGVAIFGAGMLVFAVSETLWLSVLALAVVGGGDMVSVYVRGTLVQLWTPDDLRGRVNAVNQVFIGASNELGGFRAGTMAALIGPIAAVAVGGAGTLAVVALWTRWFPDLVRIRRLTD
jgi:MFS family permease